MDREGRNWDKEEIPGSGQGMHDYILTYYRWKTFVNPEFSTDRTPISASAATHWWTGGINGHR